MKKLSSQRLQNKRPLRMDENCPSGPKGHSTLLLRLTSCLPLLQWALAEHRLPGAPQTCCRHLPQASCTFCDLSPCAQKLSSWIISRPPYLSSNVTLLGRSFLATLFRIGTPPPLSPSFPGPLSRLYFSLWDYPTYYF